MNVVRLPARLAHARDHPEQRKLAEADAAEAETAQERARSSAASAAIVLTNGELRLPLALLDHGFTGHSSNSSVEGRVVQLAFFAFSSVRNGIPSSFNSACAWSSRFTLVTNVMSMPWIWSMSS